MKYQHIERGTFIERPNRFIAYVDIAGHKETVHVKNTGRCRELLQPGVTVYLEKSDNPERKTAYDLISVMKQDRLVNMDSNAPNKAVEEWLKKKTLFPDLVLVRPETTYGNSRFDFYIETATDKIFMEVKGVTLEKNGAVFFPDAPSQRAVKHLKELIQAKQEGYKAYVMFVVQMKGVSYFAPSIENHPEFAKTLQEAADAGVQVLAYDCFVDENEMKIEDPVPVKVKGLPELTEPLLEWYDLNHRKLPWREKPTPYHVWISEIMLQQTRVEAVKPYYERFLTTLPDIASLAAAKEDILLKLWEGLGYYNRVRNMQKAAIQIIEQFDGEMPSNYETLQTLSGIGSYTAGAIASIAFGNPAPAVDGNVMRVLSRLRQEENDIGSTEMKRKMETMVCTMIPQDRPGDFTQAMIEIGALVCVPNAAPHCEKCPFEASCNAHQAGCELDYPKKALKKARTIEEKTILVIQDNEKTAIRKRPDKGLLAGMYEFPSLEGKQSEKKVLAYCKKMGLKPLRILPLQEAKHIFSHKEWHMIGYAVRVDELSPMELNEQNKDWIFVEKGEAEDKYPMPSALLAYTRYLNIRLGNDKFIE